MPIGEFAETSYLLPSQSRMGWLYTDRAEDFLTDVQPLEAVVAAWNRGNPWPAIARETRFPAAHLDTQFLVNAWNNTAQAGVTPRVALYPAGLSSKDHRNALYRYDQKAQLLTTVTVLYPTTEGGRQIFLVSSIGSFRIDDTVHAQIARASNLSHSNVKKARINPDPIFFESGWLLGQDPGTVKPIISDGREKNITGICYLNSDAFDDQTPVAITASPFEMLVIPKRS
jgi:hypothetical protein